VVFCGLAQFLTPFWFPLLAATLQNYFAVKLPESANPGWGVAIMAIGLIYHYFTMRLDGAIGSDERIERDRRHLDQINHDKILAVKVRNLFPKLVRNSFVHSMENEHVYWNNHSSALDDLYHEINESDFVFLNEKISKKSQEVSDALGPLLNVMGLKFWVWPERQSGDSTRFALWPWGNVDRAGSGDPEQMRKYDDLETDVLGKLSTFITAFDELLKLFHRELHLNDEDVPPNMA
jgi:hypothetical protein